MIVGLEPMIYYTGCFNHYVLKPKLRLRKISQHIQYHEFIWMLGPVTLKKKHVMTEIGVEHTVFTLNFTADQFTR